MSRVDLVKLGERLRDYGMDGCEASLSVRETLALADLIDTLRAAQPTSAGEERTPMAVVLAVEILCNHVEPGSWENSRTIVLAWIAEQRAALSSREGGK